MLPTQFEKFAKSSHETKYVSANNAYVNTIGLFHTIVVFSFFVLHDFFMAFMTFCVVSFVRMVMMMRIFSKQDFVDEQDQEVAER